MAPHVVRPGSDGPDSRPTEITTEPSRMAPAMTGPSRRSRTPKIMRPSPATTARKTKAAPDRDVMKGPLRPPRLLNRQSAEFHRISVDASTPHPSVRPFSVVGPAPRPPDRSRGVLTHPQAFT